MTHSPEPWKRTEQVHLGTQDTWNAIRDSNGDLVIDAYGGMYDGYYPDMSDANSARIVACVNACRGIETETLIAKADAMQTLLRLPASSGDIEHLPQ